MNYYQLQEKAVESGRSDYDGVMYAILALAVQVQGLRNDLYSFYTGEVD